MPRSFRSAALAIALFLAALATGAFANIGFGGITYGAGGLIGDSIGFGVRVSPAVTAAQTVFNIVGVAKNLIPARNAGIPGDTSVGGLARFESDVLAFHPSLIVIQFGTNDPGSSIPVGAIGTAGSYTDNIAKMIVKAQRTGARVTLWVPILAQDAVLDASIAPYRTAMRGLAATFGCDLFDTYADMAALPGATQNSYFNETPGTGQHLSVAGNAWMSGLVGSGAYTNSFVSAVHP